MPFQSEKQRRYLWANEPEIARDWTDTYGSRVKKFDGGALYNTLENQGITSINNPLSSLQQGYARHIDQNALLEQALTDNRITEDQYKRMGGYNVLQNAPSYGFIKPSAGDVGLASFGYNTFKNIADMFADNPRGYGDIGYWDSIKKNYQGAKEGLQGDELELYSSIINPRSAYIDDANYIPRNTMTAGMDPHNFEFGNQWQTPDKRNLLQRGFDYAMDTNLGQKMRTGYNIGKEKYVMPTIGVIGMLANQVNPLNPQSRNYNPELQGQIDQLQASGHLGGYDPSGPYKITSGPLKGKNLVSGFGTNDYDEMLAKKIDWFEKRKAEKKSISDKAYKKALEEKKRREEQKRTQGTSIGGGWRRHDTGGGRATFTGSRGQTHQGWSNTPAGIAAASASEASFAEGGLAGLWRR